MMDVIKSSFYPVSDVEKLTNFKRYYRIERNGKIYERILLDIPDRSLREKLIFLHFMKNYVMLFCDEAIGINIISRDSPWDFKVELSTKEVFNIEITSVADCPDTFRKFKNEERYIQNCFKQEIPFHEIEKLNKLFPDENVCKTIIEYKKNKVPKSTMVKNPYYNNTSILFISMEQEIKKPFECLLKTAIECKENKKHLEKENTVIIIDNRTVTYEYDDLHEAVNLLRDYFRNSTFKEIWFYTGYGSNIDGNNAEFSFVPLKITEKHKKVLLDKANKNPPDNNGFINYLYF